MAKAQRGVTLIELMVTIAVLAIVVTIGAPSFTSMINNNRSVALGEELATAFNYARSEAVKRGASVSVCASTNGATCSAANTWAQGWIVGTDSAAGTSAPTVTAVLRRWQAPSSAATIAANRGAATNFIRFTRLGTLEPASVVTVTSSVSGCRGNAARFFTIGPAGLVNVAPSSANCS